MNTYSDEGDIVVLGRAQSNGQNPVRNGARDNGPRHDATLRRLTMCVVGFGGRGLAAEDVIYVTSPGDPLAVL